MPQLVLTAVGADRPGLVDHLTGFLLECGGNLADSRMVNLRGQFALIMLVEASSDVAQRIENKVIAIGQNLGLTVTLIPQAGSAINESPRAGIPFRVKTTAMDQPGIVHRITHLLHRHGANIEELETRLQAGAYSGTPLFEMDMRVTVPTAVPIKQLRQEVQELCDSLNCDVDLQAG
jgi:glycine cleavage system transcriptional repressor